MRCSLDTFFDAFLHLLDPLTFFLKLGERLRRFALEQERTLARVAAKNLGFSILVPSDNAAAVRTPKSIHTAPVPVSLTGSQLTVIEANHLP